MDPTPPSRLLDGPVMTLADRIAEIEASFNCWTDTQQQAWNSHYDQLLTLMT